MHLRPLTTIAALVAVAANAGTAAAEPTSAASAATTTTPAAPTVTPPDLVLLKGGGMMRGTISELLPGEAVTIITVGGVMRRVPMSEVTYAGPAERAPQSPSKTGESAVSDTPAPPVAAAPQDTSVRPFILVQGRAVPFKFVSMVPNLTLHIKTGEAEARTWMGTPTGLTATTYTSICSAPCDASLPAGSHQFALSQGSGVPVQTPELSNLQEPSMLNGTYESKQGLRTAGWVIMIGGPVVGLALVATTLGGGGTVGNCGAPDYSCRHEEPDFTPIYVGTAI